MSAAGKKSSDKKNFFTPIINFFKDVRGELRKVVYPTFKQVRKNTLVVIISVIVVGILISGLDFIFVGIRNFVINNEMNRIDQVQQQDIQQPEEQQPIEVQPEDQQQAPQEEGSNQ